MLKPRHIATCIVLLLAISPMSYHSSVAEGCSKGTGDTYETLLTCDVQSTESGSSGGSSDSSSGSQQGGSTETVECVTKQGETVACWNGEYWWSPKYNAYCKQIPPLPQYADSHVDWRGEPTGSYFSCIFVGPLVGMNTFVVWEPGPAPLTPTSELIEETVRTAVASLGLHPPIVGVGAYVYPDAVDWGLSWWVGAPMWLWVPTWDNLQWGEHTLEASLDGNSITAKVRADKVTYDVGDGSAPVVCQNPGTWRPFSDNELMRTHSPAGCEHTYMKTNTLGDKNSRYTVSATVTWKVTWSATTGQYGDFTVDVASVDNPAIHIGEIRIVDCIPPNC